MSRRACGLVGLVGYGAEMKPAAHTLYNPVLPVANRNPSQVGGRLQDPTGDDWRHRPRAHRCIAGYAEPVPPVRLLAVLLLGRARGRSRPDLICYSKYL
jgi:hypothetical protein